MAPLVAVPPERVTADPKGALSSVNWTVPAGVPEPGATAPTVAVNATDWPNTDEFAEEATVVVVEALFTTWDSGEALLSLPLKLVASTKAAVIE